MTIQPTVQILLATYNGERFLQEQLDSIAAQTYQNWEILARDDGSIDNTLGLLKRFEARHPGKIKIIEDGEGNSGGHAQNFLKLATASTADIIAFADQDDIWHPEKIEKMVAAIQNLENEYGTQSPVMAHHDFSVIDAQNRMIIASFAASGGLRKEQVASIPVLGLARGFTLAANRALVEKALPAPDKLMMIGHDTLFSHIGKKLGHIHFIEEQLAQYRRHETNTTDFSASQRSERTLKEVFSQGSVQGMIDRANEALVLAHKNLRIKCQVAREFIDRYGEGLEPSVKKRLEEFADLENQGFWKRKQLLLQYSSSNLLTRILSTLTL